MGGLLKSFRRMLVDDKRGAAIAEYALILVFVLIVSYAAVQTFGKDVLKMFTATNHRLESSVSD